jgi:phenolic acid decarboxylase
MATETTWELVTSGATVYQSMDPNTAIVTAEIKSLNRAKIACVSPYHIENDEQVIIREVTVTDGVPSYHTLIQGPTKKYTKRTPGPETGRPSMFDYEITERAIELDKYRVHTSGGSYTVPFAENQTVTQNVTTALYGTGWTAITNTPATMSAIQTKVMSVIGALNKFVLQIAAGQAEEQWYMWFDSASKNVSWGTSRNDRSSTVNYVKGTYWGYELYVTNNSKVDGVIVFGPNMATMQGQYPVSFADHQVAVYQYNDAVSSTDCANIAAAIYIEYCRDPKMRIQFKVKPSVESGFRRGTSLRLMGLHM